MKKFLHFWLAISLAFFFSCESKGIKVDTPYGVAFKADGTGVLTDKEIEYYIIKDDFIYFHKKNAEIATYIIPKGKIKVIKPLEKP